MKTIFYFICLLTVTSVKISRPCDGEKWNSKPWCNVNLDIEERAKSLVKELTLEEKAHLMGHTNNGVARLNIPPYEWWGEALHGVGKSPSVVFKEPTPYATSFPQVSTTAQSFDRLLFRRIADTISTEARAFSNADHAKLTFWSPNVNIYRDPRWGRGHETPGEDPMLTSVYAEEFVRGLQEGEDSRYLKVSACCKHYTAYDLENWHGVKRFEFDAIVSDRDMKDTFQVPFENCVKKAHVSALMCSYNSINGIPACADRELLYGVARESWGFEGYITSDCGGIDTIMNWHHYTNTTAATVKLALEARTDQDCGDFYQSHVINAVRSGEVDEKYVDFTIINMLKVHIRLGYYDPIDKQIYTTYGVDRINTRQNQKLALTAARESIVLLKNDHDQLPLSLRNKTVLITGPFATDTEVMLGNYEGVPQFIKSVADGINKVTDHMTVNAGCADVMCANASMRASAAKASRDADVIILAVGLNHVIERETLDRYEIRCIVMYRDNLYLPKGQIYLINAILRVAKCPIIMVLLSGCGAVDISKYKDDKRIVGIIGAGYPGMFGGQAIAEVIVGDVNPSGRLVNTMYFNSYVVDSNYFEMSMRPISEKKHPGRTYRFFDGPVIYPFGFGMSYTKFEHAVDISNIPSVRRMHSTDRTINADVYVTVRNVGDRDGAESVLVFLTSPMAGIDGFPLKTLVAFDRVELTKKEETVIHFVLRDEEFRLVDSQANYVILRGEWKLTVEEAQVVFIL